MEYFNKTKDFVALCVHSDRLGFAHVKDGHIADTGFLGDSNEEVKVLASYFEKVNFLVGFNIGPHRRNLRAIFERSDSELMDKNFVCIYNWAKKNLGTTTFKSVRDKFNIHPSDNENDYDKSGWLRDYEANAVMLAHATIAMQLRHGLFLGDTISGERTPRRDIHAEMGPDWLKYI